MGKEIAGSIKIVGWIIVGLGVLIGGLAFASSLANDLPLGLDGVLVPLIIILIGGGFLLGAKYMATGAGPEMPVLGSWIFKGFGIAVMLLGLFSSFDDPAALFAIPFGAVFFGAGHLMKKLFATPEGKKQVLIPDTNHSSRNEFGQRTQHTSAFVIHVDEDASEEEIDAAVREWREERLENRTDWATNRIEGETSRTFWWRKFGPALTALVSIPLLIFAWFDGDPIIWAVGGIFGIVTFGGVYELLRDQRRWKRYGKSYVELDALPGIIGETLKGRIETEIPIGDRPSVAFRLTLNSELRWEETRGSGDDRDVRWILRAKAEMKGLDFDERFIIPIVTQDMM